MPCHSNKNVRSPVHSPDSKVPNGNSAFGNAWLVTTLRPHLLLRTAGNPRESGTLRTLKLVVPVDDLR